MKVTVEVSPEDLAVVTQQIMKAAGPEAMSKTWMAIGELSNEDDWQVD